MNTTRRLPLSSTSKIMVASLVLAAVSACGSSNDDGAKDESDSSATPSATASATTDAPESSDNQLAAYVDKVRDQSKSQMERFDDLYSDYTIEAEGDDTLVYDYTFLQQVDPDTAKTQIEGTRSMLEGAAEPIFTEMKAAGVQDPKVRWTYRNPDGSEILSIELP